MGDLNRFIDAQNGNGPGPRFESALAELRNCKKEGHWIWYVFPQIAGLGTSANSSKYALADLDEARDYLQNATLGPRLRESIEAVLSCEGTAKSIFAHDDVKFHACVTLFSIAETEDELFQRALSRFFSGPHQATLDRL